jgi:hypothetical protein
MPSTHNLGVATGSVQQQGLQRKGQGRVIDCLAWESAANQQPSKW